MVNFPSDATDKTIVNLMLLVELPAVNGQTYIHTYIHIYIHRSNIHTSGIGYGTRQEQSRLQYAIKSKHWDTDEIQSYTELAKHYK
jgi:hypothetical protein